MEHAVRELDESFSAVVIDRMARQICILSDRLGLRMLRYYREGDALWVSPHDIPIVISSACPLEINTLVAYTLLRTRAAIRNASLLRSLSETNGQSYILWSGGTLSQVEDHILSGVEKLDSRDSAGKAQLLDEMIGINGRLHV